MQEGLFAGSPTSVSQTSDGYLWIGSSQGLWRFDGVRFVSWKSLPGADALKSDDITSLVTDRDGSLWIGTGQGLVHWARGRLKVFASLEGVVSSITQNVDGVIWFTRGHLSPMDKEGPLCRVSGEKLVCHGANAGIPFRNGEGLDHDPEGGLWIGSFGNVARWKDGKATLFNVVSKQPTASGVHTILARSADEAFFALNNDGSSPGLQHINKGKLSGSALAGLNVRNLAVSVLSLDKEGTLWIGTLDSGVYRVNGGHVDNYRMSDGLSGDNVRAITQDREGNIWIATGSGLDRFRPLPIVSYTQRDGLGSSEVNAALVARDGTLWVAHRSGASLLRDGKFVPLSGTKPPPGEFGNMWQDRSGLFWLGIGEKLYTYDGHAFRFVPFPSPYVFINAISEDASGTIWVITMSSTSYQLWSIRDRHVRQEKLLPNTPQVFSVTGMPDGGLWLGFIDNSFATYKDGQLRSYPVVSRPERRVGMHPVRNIVSDGEGGVLAASSDGMVLWRNGIVRTLGVQDGLPCNFVSTFHRDTKGTLYMYLRCAVVSISAEELERWRNAPGTKANIKIYDASDGAVPGTASFGPSATATSDGKLWFTSSPSILQMIDPLHPALNTLPPPVYVESISDDGTESEAIDGMRLHPKPRSIRLDYTALSLAAPQKMKFRYKMDGFDSDWQEAGTRRQAFYTNLPPGSYTFRVIAANNDGVWNDAGASFNFRIPPTFLQTVWFQILCVVAAISLIALLFLWRIVHIQDRNRKQLSERLAERNRIARELHDTLLQGFQGLILRFQAAAIILRKEDPAFEIINKALTRADSVLKEGRDRVRDLRVQEIGSDSTVDQYRLIAEDLNTQHIDFDLIVDGETRKLNRVVHDEAYWIIREALANAFLHSRADKITLHVIFSKTRFSICVEDDGIGIDPHILLGGRAGHFGLRGMRERSEDIRAVLTIRDRRPKGTMVDLSLPARIAYASKGESFYRRVVRRIQKAKQRD